MARLWSSGFELQSATAGIEWETTNGTPSISTSTVRSGAASLRCNPTAAASSIAHTILTTGTTTAHVFLRAYIYVASAPSARTAILAWSDNATTASSFFCMKMNTDRTLIVGGSAATTGVASAAVPLNTWSLVEVDYDDSADVIKGYLNGTLFDTVTGSDLAGGGIARFGVIQAATADIYFDDIAVNDNSGTAQTGLAGAGSIVHLRPSAAGDNNGFATPTGGTAGAANNYTRVSEVTPDDTTSYNNTTATGTTTIDDFNVTDSATAGITAGSAITLVQVGQRAGSSATTTASIVTRIMGQSGGTVSESASIPVNTTAFNTLKSAAPRTYPLTAYTNPQTSTAWTTTSLDSMQIGYRGNVSQTTQRRITTLWALVEYVPSTGISSDAVALTLPHVTAAATGTSSSSGSSALTLPVAAASATGTSTSSGSSALTLPAVTGSASGTASATGTVADSLPAIQAAATGTASSTGAVADSLPVLQAAATGTSSSSGTSGLALPPLTATADGTASTSGSSTLNLPPVTTTGTAMASSTGDSAFTLPAIQAAGDTGSGLVAAVDLVFPALTLASDGIAQAAGSVSVILPAFQLTAVGVTPVEAQATLLLPALTAHGSANNLGRVITRPNTGSTVRPASGAVIRPTSGLVAASTGGRVIRPDTGRIARP